MAIKRMVNKKWRGFFLWTIGAQCDNCGLEETYSTMDLPGFHPGDHYRVGQKWYCRACLATLPKTKTRQLGQILVQEGKARLEFIKSRKGVGLQ